MSNSRPEQLEDLVLRAVAGNEIGSEVALPRGKAVVVGRIEGADFVIPDGAVSRRHTRFDHQGSVVVVEDLGSTNGTYVNGKRIERTEVVTVGDRILVGPTVFEIVAATPAGPRLRPISLPVKSKSAPERKALHREATIEEAAPWLKGDLDQVSLPDVLQLFGQLRKSGTLVISSDFGVGQIDLERGTVRYAAVEGLPPDAPEKALYRMLRWTKGEFELRKQEPRSTEKTIEASAQDLLFEGFRQLGELEQLEPALPSREQVIRPASATEGSVSAAAEALSDVEREVMQQVLITPTFGAFLDSTTLCDLDAAEVVKGLIDRGVLRTD